jgi:hypothetical protein
MEKKFKIEKIRRPTKKSDILDVAMAHAMWEFVNDEEKMMIAETDDLIEFAARFADKIVDLGWLDFKIESYGSQIVNAMSDEARKMEYFRPMLFAHLSNPDFYVVAKDFFRILRKARLKNLDWSMVPAFTAMCVRFPEPIITPSMDKHGDIRVTEMFAASIPWGTHGIETFMIFFGEDDEDDVKIATRLMRPSAGPILVETTSHGTEYNEIVMLALKMMVYIESGNPDMREHRNAIRYQTPTSTKPVRAHKEFAEHPFKIIGYNWKKDRQSFVDAWGVEPFIRMQPVGPGRKEYKAVLVREHIRQRRKTKPIEYDMGQQEAMQ